MASLHSICVGNCNGKITPSQLPVLVSYDFEPFETCHGFARNYGDLIGMSYLFRLIGVC